MDHAKKLQSLCRTCGMKIDKKSDKKHESTKSSFMYKNEIKALFGYDIVLDVPAVHPPNICGCCRRKFDRCQKNLDQVQRCDVNMLEFKPHLTVGNCDVCNRKKTAPYNFSVKFFKSEELQSSSVKSAFSVGIVASVAEKYGFVQVLRNTSNDVRYFCKLWLRNSTPTIKISVHIMTNFSWKLYVYERDVPKCSNIVKSLPEVLSPDNVDDFFQTLNMTNVCIGNVGFDKLIQNKLTKGAELNFTDRKKNIKAYIENDKMQRLESGNVIRTVDCCLLISNKEIQCSSCQNYRPTLTTLSSRCDSSNIVKKNTPNIFLSKEQLQIKAAELQRERRSLLKKQSNLEQRISSLIKKESVQVDNESHKIFDKIMKDAKPNFDPDSPISLLWDQQKKQASYKNSKSMRWHPVMIRWCLSIYLKSPGQ